MGLRIALTLFLVPSAFAQSTRLSGPMPPGFSGDVVGSVISPDGAWVVYQADADQDEVYELYSTPFAGGSATKLNGILVADGGVGTFQISPDSSRVVYLADQEVNGVAELFSVPIAGGIATKLNPPLVAGGNVENSFQISPDSSRVIYLADQTTLWFPELFSVPLAGGSATRLNSTLVTGGEVRRFSLSADSSRAVYLADQDADNFYELYSVPIAGGVATKLNPPLLFGVGTYAGAFQLSPDSSRVVYLAVQTQLIAGVFSVPIAGGSAILLNPIPVTGGGVSQFSISADSSRVVYIADQKTNDVFELFSVPIAGGETARVNSPLVRNGDVSGFKIGPDSTRVVYLADGTVDQRFELYGVPIGGGSVVKLSPSPVQFGNVSSISTVTISPDSSRVLYLAYLDTFAIELYSVPIVGGANTKLNPTLVPGGNVTAYEVGADSSRVVYLADQDVDELRELYGVPIAGGPVVQISPASPLLSSVSQPRIAPDSSAVAYLGDPDAPGVFQLYRAPTTGGPSVRLNGPLTPTPSVGDVTSHAVSPDGKRIVYIADQDYDEVLELYSVPAEGGPITKLNGPILGTGDVKSFGISADSRRVVYIANAEVSSRGDLYSVPIGGGVPRRLNDDLANCGSFLVAPDGGTVVFGAEDLSLAFPDVVQLYGVPIDGGPVILLNRLSGVSDYRISPDGNWVVYQNYVDAIPSYYNPYLDAWSVPITGGTSIQLSTVQEYCLDFVISPDSSRVVYTGDQDTAGLFELFSVPIEGGAATKLNPQLGGGQVGVVSYCPYPSCSWYPPIFTPTWAAISPDSSRVVFTASPQAGSPRALYSSPITGGETCQLSPAGASIPDTFRIAPDSARVVYVGPDGGGATNALYAVPLAGGASTQLSDPLVPGGAIQGYGVISPDSLRVVYAADADTDDVIELYGAPITGGTVAKLNDPLVSGGDVLVGGFRTSTDSRFAVYSADQDADGVNELFRAAIDGAGPTKGLNGPLVPNGDVSSWSLGPGSRLVVYTADQDVDETSELYVSFLFRHFTLAPRLPRSP